MSEPEATRDAALQRLVWPLRLTRAGMVAERVTQAFWPLWSVALLALAALAFGVHEVISLELAWFGLVLTLAALTLAGRAGIRRFHWPSPAEALDRLDRTLPGRPITALQDTQAIGATDAASVRVWQAHVARMAARALQARPVEPDLKLSRRDPYGLRYLALTAFVMAVLFGSIWRVSTVGALVEMPGGAALASGPSWEGWIQPPAYTGKPSLYLNDITAEGLSVPEGSHVIVRLYGDVGDLTLAETVSGRVGDLSEVGSASAQAQDFDVTRSGKITISGAGAREWEVTAIPDAPPVVAFAGALGHEADGRMTQPFSASDDFAVVAGRAEISLDLPRVDRSYGLAAAPEPREMLVVDLPMPISGGHAEFKETLIEDLSQHAFANLPVTITLFAEDANGQIGHSETMSVMLPGRRFFDPLAASLVEMRRDLLWSRDNGPRVSQILRAVTHLPEGFIRNQKAYLMLRVAMKRLDAGIKDGLTPEFRDEIAAVLWEIALQVEEGDLADAKARLQRAQDQLAEAIRNGANQQEIDRLMQEMNDAMQDYMNQLAEQSKPTDGTDTAQNQNSTEITQDQLQQMLDQLQKLMEEGRMAEAAELLEQLRQLMENMQVTQGEGGKGGKGQQSMQGLSDTLRDQQGLSDDAFSNLQDQFNPGGGQPGQPGEGQPGEGQPGGGKPGEGQPGEGQQGGGQAQPGQGDNGTAGQQDGSLADRQQALRNQLEAQRRGLPGVGTPEGDAAREALDQAGRAMDGAEQALRNGDIPGAIDRQAEAMEALREGIRNLGEVLAQNQTDPSGHGQAAGKDDPNGQQDPLGRDAGTQGRRAGTPENMLQGEDVYRRARELLDELRRRSGDQTRPSVELEYLKRLLERF